MSDIVPNNIKGVFLLLPYGYCWMLYRSNGVGTPIDSYPNYATLQANNGIYDYRFLCNDGDNAVVIENHSITSSTSPQATISACAVYQLSDFMF